MFVVGKKTKDGWRIFSVQENKYFGPAFENEEDIDDFVEYYDGDITLIGTCIIKETWKQAIEKWQKDKSTRSKNKTHSAKEKESIQTIKNSPNLYKMSQQNGATLVMENI